MRIAMFTNVYPPLMGGVSVSVETFRRELSRLGHVVSVFAPSVEGSRREYEADEPFVFRLRALDLSKPLNLALPLALKPEVMPILRGFKPDIIHSHHPYLIGDLAAKCARELDRPLVFTYHTTYLDHASLYFRRAPKLAAQVVADVIQGYLDRCHHVIAPTRTIRDDVCRTFRLSCPVTVLPTPIDLSLPDPALRERIRRDAGLSDKKVLVYVGRLSREKSIDALLESFARVLAQVPNAHLVLAGGGPGSRAAKRRVREGGLGACVTLTGPLPRHDVARHLMASDVFVMTSKTETQGIAVLEAMAAGLPVVAVRAGGTSDVVSDGTGLLVPPDDAEAFAVAAVHLLRDEGLRRRMGWAGKEAAALYGPPVLTKRLVELYETLFTVSTPQLTSSATA